MGAQASLLETGQQPLAGGEGGRQHPLGSASRSGSDTFQDPDFRQASVSLAVATWEIVSGWGSGFPLRVFKHPHSPTPTKNNAETVLERSMIEPLSRVRKDNIYP